MLYWFTAVLIFWFWWLLENNRQQTADFLKINLQEEVIIVHSI